MPILNEGEPPPWENRVYDPERAKPMKKRKAFKDLFFKEREWTPDSMLEYWKPPSGYQESDFYNVTGNGSVLPEDPRQWEEWQKRRLWEDWRRAMSILINRRSFAVEKAYAVARSIGYGSGLFKKAVKEVDKVKNEIQIGEGMKLKLPPTEAPRERGAGYRGPREPIPPRRPTPAPEQIDNDIVYNDTDEVVDVFYRRINIHRGDHGETEHTGGGPLKLHGDFDYRALFPGRESQLKFTHPGSSDRWYEVCIRYPVKATLFGKYSQSFKCKMNAGKNTTVTVTEIIGEGILSKYVSIAEVPYDGDGSGLEQEHDGSELDQRDRSAAYFIPGLCAIACLMLALIGLKKWRSFLSHKSQHKLMLT